jgi:hypothetical protein
LNEIVPFLIPDLKQAFSSRELRPSQAEMSSRVFDVLQSGQSVAAILPEDASEIAISQAVIAGLFRQGNDKNTRILIVLPSDTYAERYSRSMDWQGAGLRASRPDRAALRSALDMKRLTEESDLLILSGAELREVFRKGVLRSTQLDSYSLIVFEEIAEPGTISRYRADLSDLLPALSKRLTNFLLILHGDDQAIPKPWDVFDKMYIIGATYKRESARSARSNPTGRFQRQLPQIQPRIVSLDITCMERFLWMVIITGLLMLNYQPAALDVVIDRVRYLSLRMAPGLLAAVPVLLIALALLYIFKLIFHVILWRVNILGTLYSIAADTASSLKEIEEAQRQSKATGQAASREKTLEDLIQEMDFPGSRLLVTSVGKIARWVKKITSAWSGKEGWIREWKVVYKADQEDFEESFTFESPDGEIFGEWGIGIAGRAPVAQKIYAYAFKISLQDEDDGRSITQLIVSPQALAEGLYHETLTTNGESHAAAPGVELNVETQRLQLIIRMDDVTFVNLPEAPNRYFQSAKLTFNAYIREPYSEWDEEEPETAEPPEASVLPEQKKVPEFQIHNESDVSKRIKKVEEYKDPLLEMAREIAEQYEQVSVSLLQRRLRIGYMRSVRLIEGLVDSGVLKEASTEGKYVVAYTGGEEE